jgi:hypothetical protein
MEDTRLLEAAEASGNLQQRKLSAAEVRSRKEGRRRLLEDHDAAHLFPNDPAGEVCDYVRGLVNT